jgi:hypothetical protein
MTPLDIAHLYDDLDSATSVITRLSSRVRELEMEIHALESYQREQVLFLIQSNDREDRRVGWRLAVQFGMAKEVTIP